MKKQSEMLFIAEAKNDAPLNENFLKSWEKQKAALPAKIYVGWAIEKCS